MAVDRCCFFFLLARVVGHKCPPQNQVVAAVSGGPAVKFHDAVPPVANDENPVSFKDPLLFP